MLFNKKIINIWLLIAGTLLFLVSYKLDTGVSLFFKNAKSPLLAFVLSIITNFGVVVAVMLAIPLIMLFRKNRKAAYFLFLAFISSAILAFIIKLVVLRQRPMEAFTYPFTNIINYSFPSMHSMAVFSLLPLLAKYLPKQKFFWAGFAFLVAFSRIYLGFHFLSDVMFGAFAGYFTGIYALGLCGKNNGKRK